MIVLNISKDIVDVIIAQILLDYDPDEDDEGGKQIGNIFAL